MRPSILLLQGFLICISFRSVSAQAQETTVPTLLETISIDFSPGNVAVQKLFPPATFEAKTPIAIRYALFASELPHHEIIAACDPTILSFFGTKDVISPQLCSEEAQEVIRSYITFRLIDSEFPTVAREYGTFLANAGLTPYSSSRNKDTRIGWANTISDRLIAYFGSDGWNSQGDADQDQYHQRFSNSVSYIPQNPAYLPSGTLIRPLRWQPLTQALDAFGNYGSQVHITPQIAFDVAPLTMSREELFERQVDAPYESKNQLGSPSAVDEARMRKLIDKLFDLSANLTTTQVALSHWWDSKFASLANVVPLYLRLLNIKGADACRANFADMLGLHDAAVLAWKEKLRHDLVRPPTIIRHLLKGTKVRAFKGFGKGAGIVDAEQWEPVVPIQPHSEFPSASAVLCQTTADVLTTIVKDVLGNVTMPPIEFVIKPFSPSSSPVDVPVVVEFKTVADVVESCGHSRLLAGVHFEPSVEAGYRLAAGVGQKAAEHVSALYAGKVPENCARCIRNE